jgi:hypothetical protein
VLGNDQEITIRRIECFLAHIFAGCIEQNAQALLHSRVTGSGDQVKAMYPIYLFVKVEWVPSQLVGDVVKLLRFSCHRSMIRVFILGYKVLVGCCR